MSLPLNCAGTETSISPRLSYSSKYDGVTVKLLVEPGTSESLQEIGIAANKPAAEQPQSLYSHRPVDGYQCAI